MKKRTVLLILLLSLLMSLTSCVGGNKVSTAQIGDALVTQNTETAATPEPTAAPVALKGSTILSPILEYDTLAYFSEDLIYARKGDEHGFIDKYGNVVLL